MKPLKVVVIDYGLGNLYSVKRALEVCGADNVCISDSAEDILTADRVVLPGVGAFADGMAGLRAKNLVEPIRNYAASGRPLLGICLGMQMLSSVGEEFGEHEGLGLIPGYVRALPVVNDVGDTLKSPHIGWSSLERPESADWSATVLGNTSEGSSVYLVHSYAVEPSDKTDLLSYYWRGGAQVTAVVKRGQIYGCQFHPEKSGAEGLKIIKAFLTLGSFSCSEY